MEITFDRMLDHFEQLKKELTPKATRRRSVQNCLEEARRVSQQICCEHNAMFIEGYLIAQIYQAQDREDKRAWLSAYQAFSGVSDTYLADTVIGG